MRHALNDIFYIFDYERIGAYEFKISRDAQLDIDNDFSEGHVRKMERVLKQRKAGRPTRLVHDATMPMELLQLLRGTDENHPIRHADRGGALPQHERSHQFPESPQRCVV
ncbi:MAG: hypothetical protein ACOX5J_09480 [Candidatus Hydrogenedentales bacterium]